VISVAQIVASACPAVVSVTRLEGLSFGYRLGARGRVLLLGDESGDSGAVSRSFAIRAWHGLGGCKGDDSADGPEQTGIEPPPPEGG
jgi:hypothetical protein